MMNVTRKKMIWREQQQRVKVFSEKRLPLPLGPQPASCTVAVFSSPSTSDAAGKKGQASSPPHLLLLDPTDEEEAISSSLVTVVLARKEEREDADEAEEEVVHCRKAGGAAVSRDLMAECATLARKQAAKVRKMLDRAAPLKDLTAPS